MNADNTWDVRCDAVGKASNPESPYLLANEWIAGSLAQILRLPVPPFSIVSKKSRSTAMFASYSFEGVSKPKDALPIPLYAAFPHLCTGIVVFDVLIANCDRHGGNIKVDNPDKPTAVYIFDHERALFYIYQKEGIKRLDSRKDRLGVTDGSDSRDEWHCLVELLDSVESLIFWIQRVAEIPNQFIKSICEEMWKFQITRAECDAVQNFLIERKDRIAELILKHKDRFPKVPKPWPMFL